MEEAIRQFSTQFLWKPKVVHADRMPSAKTFILNGMGGSHLAADVLHSYRPDIDLSVFSDYGLPPVPKARLTSALFIASSFSGNTEEALDFAEKALAEKLPLAVIAKGGKLLDFAQKHKLPHVVLPPTNIQPRLGLGFQILALAALFGEKTLLKELAALASTLKPEKMEPEGKALAGALRGEIPVICSSSRNQALAYNWKIKFNETGKIPAFCNVFPELNHNEMTGFDVIATTESLSRTFHFVFLVDDADHPQIHKRMQVTKKLYEDRGLSVAEVPIQGKNTLEKMFSSLLIADWAAVHIAKLYGAEAEQVPMVEEFKTLITK